MKPTTVKFHTFINVCKGRLYGEVLYLHNCSNRTLKTPELKDYAFHYDCINIHYKSVDRDGDKVQLDLLTVVYKYEQVNKLALLCYSIIDFVWKGEEISNVKM